MIIKLPNTLLTLFHFLRYGSAVPQQQS